MPGTTFTKDGALKNDDEARLKPQRTQSAVSAGSVVFDNLNGDLARAYDLVIQGRVHWNGVNGRQVSVRLSGLSKGDQRNTGLALGATDASGNARSTWVRSYIEPSNDSNNGPQLDRTSDLGLSLGNTQWSADNNVVLTSNVSVHSDSNPVHVFNAIYKPLIGGPGMMQESGGGFMYYSRDVRTLTVDFGGGTFTGTIILTSHTNDGLGLSPYKTVVLPASGRVAANGTVLTAGTNDWTVNRTAAGLYTVILNTTPAWMVPSAFASGDGTQGASFMVDSNTPNSFRVLTRNAAGTFADFIFGFHVARG